MRVQSLVSDFWLLVTGFWPLEIWLIELTGLIELIGLIKLIELIGLIKLIELIGLIKLIVDGSRRTALGHSAHGLRLKAQGTRR
jgi:hypothetical protein